MGNILKKRQTNNVEVVMSDQMRNHAAKLRREILAVVNANADVGVKWKQEWKIAIEEMVDQITVSSNSFGLVIQFNTSSESSASGLLLQPAVNFFSGWIFPPEFSNSFLHDDEHGNSPDSSIQMKVRKCLGLDQLPWNLWCEIFQKFYSSSDINSICENGAPHRGMTRLSQQVKKQLYLESQVYVLLQHYAPSIFRDVFCDRGWIYFSSVRNEDEDDPYNWIFIPYFALYDTKYVIWHPTLKYRDRICEHIVLGQCRNLLQLLFRHDQQKLCSVEQLLQIISASVRGRLTSTTLTMKTVFPQICSKNTQSATLVFTVVLLPPLTLDMLAVDDGLVLPTTLTAKEKIFITTPEFKELKVMHAEEMFLLEKFTPQELVTIFRAVAKINIEYAYLLDELGSKFPQFNDHYNDPKNLRGSVTETPVYKEMESFAHLISSAQEFLSGNNDDNSCKLPTALAKLVTDYFEFPPPSINCEAIEWKVETPPLNVW